MKENNSLLQLFGGAVLCAAGLFLLSHSVQVTSTFGMGYFALGSMQIPSGLIIIPLLLGIFWFIVNTKSLGAKILMVAGIVIIVVGIMASVRFYFIHKSLYEYILMIGMIVAGAALLARALLMGKGK